MRTRDLVLAVIGATALSAPTAFARQSGITNSIGMQFVLIEPGAMQVGVFKPGCPPVPGAAQAAPPAAGPAGAPAARPPPDPRNVWTPEDYALCARLSAADRSEGFPVAIAKPYYIGKYEVTQAEWKAVMGSNPSVFKGDKVPDDGDRHPVDSVSWKDAQAFVTKLNAREKTRAYRLPTEFEWEFACRAGGPGQQPWAAIRLQGNVGAGGGFGAGGALPGGGAAAVTPAVTAKRYGPTTAAVGSKQPNAWGLYDMLGNTWEWTADRYNEKQFADPKPGQAGSEHVLKGGGLASDVKNAICATHGGGPGDGWDVGFRIVRAP